MSNNSFTLHYPNSRYFSIEQWFVWFVCKSLQTCVIFNLCSILLDMCQTRLSFVNDYNYFYIVNTILSAGIRIHRLHPLQMGKTTQGFLVMALNCIRRWIYCSGALKNGEYPPFLPLLPGRFETIVLITVLAHYDSIC